MNKKAIITGGSTGVGRATAIALAKAGHDVVVSNAGMMVVQRAVHALGVLVKCLALHLSPLNITVNAVAPGEIATPMNGMEPDEFEGSDRPAIPVRRSGHPDEIASVIGFLAGDAAVFVTGARWPDDGVVEAATPLAASAYREAYLNG